MIELRPVNVKRLELVKMDYVETMTNYFQPITQKPRKVVEQFFTVNINRMIGRKWEHGNQHFREMYLMPDNTKLGFLWYRTHKEEMFSDMALLQWVNTLKKSDLRTYAKEIMSSLIDEVSEMGIKRISVETYGENDEFAGLWEEMGFEPVRMIMHKRLSDST